MPKRPLRANHENDLAVPAFQRYLELTRGKDSAADKRVEEDIAKMGGDPKGKPPSGKDKPATGKKKPKGK